MNSFRALKLKLPDDLPSIDGDGSDYSGHDSSMENYLGRMDPSLYIAERLLSNCYNSMSEEDKLINKDFSQFYANFSRLSSVFQGIRFHAAANLHNNVTKPRFPHADHDVQANTQSRLYAPVPPLIYVPPIDYVPANMQELVRPKLPEAGSRDHKNAATPKLSPPKRYQHTLKRRLPGVTYPGDYSVKCPTKQCKSNHVKSKKDCKKKCETPDAQNTDPGVIHEDCERTEGCFRCHYCSRKFSYICHMKVHERVHTGEKPYSCELCDHQFSQLGSLTVHMRIHTGDKPYQCGECWKKFRHVNSLRRHQRQVHNMTSEQIACSIDKVKDALFLDNQLRGIKEPANNTSRINSPASAHTPFEFQPTLQFYPMSFPWSAIPGNWNDALKNKFVFGRPNQPSSKVADWIRSVKKDSETPERDVKSKKAPATWRPFEVGPEEDRKETEWSSKQSRERLTSFDTVDRFHEVCDSLESSSVKTRPPPLLQPYANKTVGPNKDANEIRKDAKRISPDPEMKEYATEEESSVDEGFSSCGSPERLRSPRADFGS